MGIFEIIILVASAIIFVILVRRFPETSGGTTHQARFSLPKFSLPKLPHRESGNNSPDNIPFDQDTDLESETPTLVRSTAQFEPGTTDAELEVLPTHLRRILSDANSHFEAGRTEEAEKLYLEAATEDPKCTLAYNRLGLIYLKKDNGLADAEEAFHQALKFAPGNGYIYNNLGLVAFKKGLYNEAINYYKQAINADPRIAERHANVGATHLSLRQYPAAIRHLAKAWSLEPQNQEYKELLDDAKARERRQRSTKL